MSGKQSHEQGERARRLELILQQVDSLPTLPDIATRLLQLTSSEESDAKEVIKLVESDPSLTAKVLALCQSAEKGLAGNITTVDRAVVVLGFEAIRNAVLSIKVCETFAEEKESRYDDPAAAARQGAADTAPARFTRAAFWRHALAVAIAAEQIAQRHESLIKPYRASEAFVAGLLHDVGKLAIDLMLPRSYQRVVELTEQHQLNIADVERRVIGLDHHTVGKRLAEHWRLPHVLIDCIWLHGSPRIALPDLPHRTLVEIVTIADQLVRNQHIGYSGNHEQGESLERRCEEAGLDPKSLAKVSEQLHSQLEIRADAMGLGKTPSRKLFLESIMQANAVLGRLNTQLESKRKTSAHQGRVLEAIVEFEVDASRPGRGVQDVLGSVAKSAGSLLGRGYYGLLYQAGKGQPWLFTQFGADGRPVRSQFIEPTRPGMDLDGLSSGPRVSLALMQATPWIAEHIIDPVEVGRLEMLPMPCGWGTAGVLLLERRELPDKQSLDAILHTWGAAIGAATQYQGARRLGEKLVETGRELARTQQDLTRHEAMARVGEMAAGAAHEMNNPLAVICGRAQLLAMKLGDTPEARDARQIFEQSQRLSDLITSLRLFAEPPEPNPGDVTAERLIQAALRRVHETETDHVPISVTGAENIPTLYTDADQVSWALAELLLNAVQSDPDEPIRVTATVDPLNDRLLFKVIDAGRGMDRQTLEHAFDPFFSAKPAGRRVGLGLSRAKRIVEALGGTIELSSSHEAGTTATLCLPLKTPDDREQKPPLADPDEETLEMELAAAESESRHEQGVGRASA